VTRRVAGEPGRVCARVEEGGSVGRNASDRNKMIAKLCLRFSLICKLLATGNREGEV
jgi:hypothetical protein